MSWVDEAPGLDHDESRRVQRHPQDPPLCRSRAGVFVVMYFVTGYPIIHNQWFDARDPVKTEHTVAIPSIEADDIREYSAHLQ